MNATTTCISLSQATTDTERIKVFEEKQVRTLWDSDKEGRGLSMVCLWFA